MSDSVKVLVKEDGSYIIVIRREGPLEVARYSALGTEPAMGITNKLPNGHQVLFLELDDHRSDTDDILKGLDERGIPVFLVARTQRGWHVITRFYGTGKAIAERATELAEFGLCDEGYAELTRERASHHSGFTQILRVWGKYNHGDIVVKRWSRPLSAWERAALQLYARHTTFEISVTRLAHNCPMYTTAAPEERLKEGREFHEAMESRLRVLGAKTEVPLEVTLGRIRVKGKADAIIRTDKEASVIELKSSAFAVDSAAVQQAAIYAAMHAALTGLPTTPYVIAGDRLLWSGETQQPAEARQKLLARLGKVMAMEEADCATCYLKFCKWRRKQKYLRRPGKTVRRYEQAGRSP